jgi:hypothetical protein
MGGDILSDARLSMVPFGELKQYILEKNVTLKKELFMCSTKFAVVHLADKYEISLDPLLDKLGPYQEKVAKPKGSPQSERATAERAAEERAAAARAARKAAASLV